MDSDLCTALPVPCSYRIVQLLGSVVELLNFFFQIQKLTTLFYDC
jgi:hypothetical protein